MALRVLEDAARLAAEQDRVTGLADDLSSGALPWPDRVPDGIPDPF